MVDKPPVPEHKMTINVEVVRELIREGGKKKTERYLTQAKVYADKIENGEWAYYYIHEDDKVPVKWNEEAQVFIEPVKKGVAT